MLKAPGLREKDPSIEPKADQGGGLWRRVTPILMVPPPWGPPSCHHSPPPACCEQEPVGPGQEGGGVPARTLSRGQPPPTPACGWLRATGINCHPLLWDLPTLHPALRNHWIFSSQWNLSGGRSCISKWKEITPSTQLKLHVVMLGGTLVPY